MYGQIRFFSAACLVAPTLNVACSATAVEKPPLAPVAAPAAPLEPEVLALTVSGAVRSAATVTPVEATKVLHSGDFLYLVLRATRPANAYIAYCDSARTLRVYPPHGALAVGPDRELRVPETQDFRVDTNAGLETIYVVASIRSLHVTDPRLARALDSAARSSERPPCAAELRMTTDESRRADGMPSVANPEQKLSIAEPTQPKPPQTPDKHPAHFPEVPGHLRPRGFELAGAPMSGISVRADEAGIAIVALTFQHDP